MLWYKGWLETRFRLLFALVFVVFFLVSAHSSGIKEEAAGVKAYVANATLVVAIFCVLLAGAGINTQAALQASKGLHGSMLFTLSLPVSRFRLLAIRAGLGWLEMAGAIGVLYCGMWILSPALMGTTPQEMLKHTVALIVCAPGLYSITLLLATFLDDQWRMWGSMIAFAPLWWLGTPTNRATVPTSLNIFRAMGESSPLIAHIMPWSTMAFSPGLAAILFFAALTVVQNRQY